MRQIERLHSVHFQCVSFRLGAHARIDACAVVSLPSLSIRSSFHFRIFPLSIVSSCCSPLKANLVSIPLLSFARVPNVSFVSVRRARPDGLLWYAVLSGQFRLCSFHHHLFHFSTRVSSLLRFSLLAGHARWGRGHNSARRGTARGHWCPRRQPFHTAGSSALRHRPRPGWKINAVRTN